MWRCGYGEFQIFIVSNPLPFALKYTPIELTLFAASIHEHIPTRRSPTRHTQQFAEN